MLARAMERKPGVEQVVNKRGSWGLTAAICGSLFLWALPAQVSAQCGVGGLYHGECVDLVWLPAQQTVLVGETFEVGLYAVSVNAYGQPIQGIDAVVNWDEVLLEIENNVDRCTADDTVDPCYFCPANDPPGAPASYNWTISCFSDDSGLDYLNEGCELGACCPPTVTGTPVNDGDVRYGSVKQVLCNGLPAPPPEATSSGLLVTNFRFVALEAGLAEVSMAPGAPCVTMEMWCRHGPNEGDPCSSEADCGGRTCVGGSQHGEPCDVHADCTPNGACLVICTACYPEACCTADESCSICSFAETRVIGGVELGQDVTHEIGPPAQITIMACEPPTVWTAGPRYLGVDVPARVESLGAGS